jgi:hypothetical protein
VPLFGLLVVVGGDLLCAGDDILEIEELVLLTGANLIWSWER